MLAKRIAKMFKTELASVAILLTLQRSSKQKINKTNKNTFGLCEAVAEKNPKIFNERVVQLNQMMERS